MTWPLNSQLVRRKLQQPIEAPHNYLIWDNEMRIKMILGNMSPLANRRNLGLAA